MAGLEDLNILDQLRIGLAAGLYDDSLDRISDMVAARRSLLRAAADEELRESLQYGDRVVITDKVRPKYLTGNFGTVQRVKPDGLIEVLMDKQLGKFSRTINFHPPHVRKL